MPAGMVHPGHETTSRSRALLDAWEHGEPESPGERALTLLAARDPSTSRGELAELTVGARDRRLLALRRELFGAAVDALVTCPRCAESVELRFDVDDIVVEGGEPLGSRVDVETESGTLSLRLPTAGDLAASHASADPERALAVLLDRMLPASGDGPRPGPDALTPETVARIGTALAAADPQADVSFDVACPACEASFQTPLDIAAFVWSELTDWAARLLADVHALALAYGWREQDTLALSPGRRRFYLEAVGA